jgi:hypothetical protein
MSKKVIKLTEKNIESLVTKIIKEDGISELDKKTYASAATKARERGMSKLGDKFAAHGSEHGTNIVDSISFDIEKMGTIVIGNMDFKNDHNPWFVGDVVSDSGSNGKRYRFELVISERSNELKTYLLGNNVSLPSTVKDAKNYLQLLNDNGIDTFNIKPKQITSGYVDYMSESLSVRERDTQNTLKHNTTLLNELLKEGLSESNKVSYDVMVQKLRNAKMLGEWGLVDEVITDLTNYLGDNVTPMGNRNTWPFK